MSRLVTMKLPTGQWLFKPKRGHGLMYYPSLPEKLQGTKDAFRPDFDISHPDDYPDWIQNMQTEHATVEMRDGWTIWWGGTVIDGIWCGNEKTLFMGGNFRSGIILGGHFWNVNVKYVEKRGGHIHSGIWHDGLHRAGRFEGLWLGGTWMGGEFHGFRERTTKPPSLLED